MTHFVNLDTLCHKSHWACRGEARQALLTMHRMQTMQRKTRLSRRCAKSVQKCTELQKMENPTRNLTILRWILVRSRELESLALWLKESEVHHSSNLKSTKKRKFIRIIARFIFAHTALFAYSVILCNGYPPVQVCKKCAKVCRRAKQSPMDKSTTGFMAGFRTSEQTPFT